MKDSVGRQNEKQQNKAEKKKSRQNVPGRSGEELQRQRKSKKCLELFLTFFKIGAFTFGGGYAMVSLIQQETAERKKWVSQEDILDMLAIAESTPGPIAINSATFVGFKRAGFWGALSATFGVVLPCFVIISILSYFIREIKDLKPVVYAFQGIRVGIIVSIGRAVLSMWKSCKRNWFFYLLFFGAFLAAALTEINVILLILAGAVAGIALTFAQGKMKKEGK